MTFRKIALLIAGLRKVSNSPQNKFAIQLPGRYSLRSASR